MSRERLPEPQTFRSNEEEILNEKMDMEQFRYYTDTPSYAETHQLRSQLDKINI